MFTKKSVFAGAAVLLCSTASYVAGQGCSNRCPPNNYGVIVPALCEGDYIDDASSGEAVDLEHVYAVCSPAAPTTSTIENATPLQFTWNDLRGPSNTVTVIANYYTGCNAGRRESGYVVYKLSCYLLSNLWKRLSRNKKCSIPFPSSLSFLSVSSQTPILLAQLSLSRFPPHLLTMVYNILYAVLNLLIVSLPTSLKSIMINTDPTKSILFNP